MSEKKLGPGAFGMAIVPPIVMGSLLCGAFYAALQIPLLKASGLQRYALCHWVAIAAVWLFCVAASALAAKWMAVRREHRLAGEASTALRSIVESRQELAMVSGEIGGQLAVWLETLWRSQKTTIVQSWYGRRVSDFIERQAQRRSVQRVDEDLHQLAEAAADDQHASYAMIRIICWAMPMLGFLGTVLGISDTLGHMDAQALASGSQKAMNDLTGGLYVAFDTTAVGLVLTMVAMFMQFGIQRYEAQLLSRIDRSSSHLLASCFSEGVDAGLQGDVRAALRELGTGVQHAMQQAVQQQSHLWRDTISEAHSHWRQVSVGATDAAKTVVLDAMRESLTEYRLAMREQIQELLQLQAEGAKQIDARLHQWQTTISEQARVALRQQQEMNKHSELLQQLLDSSQLVGAMREPIETTLNRLTDVDRFHDAAVCLAEAVAVLGTQMERYGYLGRQPVRRRAEDPAGGVPETEIGTSGLAVVRHDDDEDGQGASVSQESDSSAPASKTRWMKKAG